MVSDILLMYQHNGYKILCNPTLEKYVSQPHKAWSRFDPQELDFICEIKRRAFGSEEVCSGGLALLVKDTSLEGKGDSKLKRGVEKVKASID